MMMRMTRIVTTHNEKTGAARKEKQAKSFNVNREGLADCGPLSGALKEFDDGPIPDYGISEEK